MDFESSMTIYLDRLPLVPLLDYLDGATSFLGGSPHFALLASFSL